MNVRTILLALSVLTLLSVGIGGGGFYLHFRGMAVDEARQDTVRTAVVMADKVSLYLDRQQRASLALAGSPLLAEALAHPDGGSLAVVNTLIDRHCGALAASVCYLMDGTGTTIASSNRDTPTSFVGKNYAFRPYFQEALAGRPAIYLALGVTSKKRGIYFSSPVTAQQGTKRGVIVVKASTDDLDDLFANVPGIAMLSDANGVVFASNRDDWVFHSLRPLEEVEAEAISKSLQFGTETPSWLGLSEAVDGRVSGPDGAVYLIGAGRLDLLAGWRVMYLFDTDLIRILGFADQSGYMILSGFGILFLVTCFGVVVLFRTGARDLRRRMEAAQAIRESEQHLRNAQRIAQLGIWTWHAETDVLECSDEFRRALGSEEEMIDNATENFIKLIHPDDRERVVEAIEKTIHERAPYDIEYRVVRPADGRTVWIHTLAEHLYDDQGNLVAISGIARDITERKRTVKALHEAKEQAELASRSKSEFLAGMSHELRTPLNSIIGFAEMMEGEFFGPLGDDKYREYATDIKEGGGHLLRIIGEILDISKIEAGEIDFTEVEIDVADVVAACERLLKERAARADVAVSTDTPQDLPKLFADETRVKQILLNLLANAIKFTPPRGSVTVSAGCDGDGGIVVRVIDTGCGIAAEDIPRVLEPFEQVEDIMIRSHEGVGLGLPLSKRLIELHGGTLDIDSVPGKGTTMSVRFPAERTIAR